MYLRTWSELDEEGKLTLAALWTVHLIAMAVAHDYPLLVGASIALAVLLTVVVLLDAEEEE